MPQRTNDFQKLVKIINSHLAPSGAKITESAMLYDNDAETNREVDILVEAECLNCEIKIGIECNARATPLDTTIIEGFKEKHRKLGIHQTIVVSKHGFSKTAKNYAGKNNIKLLTFSAAIKENWSEIYERFKGLSFYSRTYFLKEVSLKMPPNCNGANFNMNLSVQAMLPDGPMPVAEFATNIFKFSDASERAFKELKDNEENGNDPWVKVGFNIGGKIEFKDQNGQSVWPELIEVVLGYKSKYRDLNVGEVSYDGKDLVAGGFFDKKSNESAYIAIAEEAGSVIGKLEISGAMFPSVPENARSKK